MHRSLVVATLIALTPSVSDAQQPAVSGTTPLVIGQTFTIASSVLHEVRRINVYVPPSYGDTSSALPVLYMPDGGIAEDFLHVAGLVQVLVGNGTMRPFILVGIENTERRRDMTGPTADPEDRKIAIHTGGSTEFRKFIRTELMPEIRLHHRTTSETAIIGESLAGLFVIETLLLEPDLFDTYIAFDPSLWWNNEQLLKGAASMAGVYPSTPKRLYFANSSDALRVQLLDAALQAAALRPGRGHTLVWQYVPMPQESHATIYHPAALAAFRALFKPLAGH